MGIMEDIVDNADKEVEKMKKKQELKEQLEKAKKDGAEDQKNKDQKSM